MGPVRGVLRALLLLAPPGPARAARAPGAGRGGLASPPRGRPPRPAGPPPADGRRLGGRARLSARPARADLATRLPPRHRGRSPMNRVLEPELMTDPEQAEAYAAADFAAVNQGFVDRFRALLSGLARGLVGDLGCGPAVFPIRTCAPLPGGTSLR